MDAAAAAQVATDAAAISAAADQAIAPQATAESSPSVAFQFPVAAPQLAAETELLSIITKVLGPIGMIATWSTTGEPPSTYYVYHYTTDDKRDLIQAANAILPMPPSNLAWVTPTIYSSGVAAQSDLSLKNTPDGFFVIPKQNITSPLSWNTVPRGNDQTGGGIQGTTPSPISVTGAVWVPLGH